MSPKSPLPIAFAPIYPAAVLREVERAAAGAPLMERAGAAAAAVAQRMTGAGGGGVLVLAGPGNNGGDAFVVARLLAATFHDVTVVFAGDAARLPPDAAAALAAWRAAGGSTLAAIPRGWRGELVIDGLFGIGLARPATEPYAAQIAFANAGTAPVLALDLPSGLDADTGRAHGEAIRATATATFIAWKPGLLTGDGPDLAGDVGVHPLGLDPEAIVTAPGYRLDWPTTAPLAAAALGRQRRNVHKGTFGTLAILGGAPGMAGAALLAGRAALAAGTGKVWVGFLADVRPAVDFTQPELMLRAAADALAGDSDAIVCGPGLGRSDAAHALLAEAITRPVPLALDADALNMVAADAALAMALAARTAPTLLTPHPAEAARLAGVATDDVERDRVAAARALARHFNATVVLKGAGSVLAAPDGGFDVNASGNPGLASGGTGDVLAGFAGALLAQGLAARTALRIAVCLHGAAADACVAQGVGPIGLTASELIPQARALLNAAAAADAG
jgi:hydroxyethylthiazole kinase-like uncharacterized protein yjeF